MFNFILVLLILFVVARVFGALAVRVKAPSVVGEIIAGLMVAPCVSLFPLDIAAQTAFSSTMLVFGTAFLFVAGLELNLSHLRRNFRAATQIGLAGLVVPALAGTCAVFFASEGTISRLRGADDVADWRLAAIFATVLSISAVPVIAKTLSDLGLLGSRVGALTISAAVFDDLIGWMVITFVIGSSSSWTALLLGAVAIGVLVKEGAPTIDVKASRAIWVVRSIFAPVYFASLALKVDFIAHFDLELVAFVLALGIASKFFACSLAARFSGIESREAWSIGAAMSSRGAMGLVFATAAREARVISAELYVAFVLLAIISSLLSGPAIRRLMRSSGAPEKGFEKWQTD
ncbi:MAG: cation:proton antiporter [Bdellovibrionota bacterium]